MLTLPREQWHGLRLAVHGRFCGLDHTAQPLCSVDSLAQDKVPFAQNVSMLAICVGRLPYSTLLIANRDDPCFAFLDHRLNCYGDVIVCRRSSVNAISAYRQDAFLCTVAPFCR